jgi:nicotinamidase/pyrazinamidase
MQAPDNSKHHLSERTMKPLVHLLIIDPQNDFCDLPESRRPLDAATGQRLQSALPVPGAHADMQRLAHFVSAASKHLDQITVTLDSHHRLHIAHPGFWQTGAGAAVQPFTTITAAQVRAGEFAPRRAEHMAQALSYLDQLEQHGRYTLMVWPVHCELGSWGHNVHADLRAAYNAWEDADGRVVNKIIKGSNLWTEHYSAVQAEVPRPDDPATELNQALLQDLDRADHILVAGEAGSHCVRATTEHIAQYLPSGRPQRITLLTDCMSPVSGFEAQQADFLRSMRERGLQLAPSGQILADINSRSLRA